MVMSAVDSDGGVVSSRYSVTCAWYQTGCFLAPLPLSISAILLGVVFQICTYRCSSAISFISQSVSFSKAPFQNYSHIYDFARATFCYWLCPDSAYTWESPITLLNFFVTAIWRFGLQVSLKKTEVWFKPSFKIDVHTAHLLWPLSWQSHPAHRIYRR